MKKLLILLILLYPTIALSFTPPRIKGYDILNSYTIKSTQSLSRNVNEAIRSWNEVNGAEFLVVNNSKANIVISEEDLGYDKDGNKIDGYTINRGSKYVCKIVIDTHIVQKTTTVMHEVGHCLGFDDDYVNKYSIMYWKDFYTDKVNKDFKPYLPNNH